MDYSQYISDIDTTRFGFKIAKINNFPSSPLAALEGLRAEGCQLVMSRLPLSHIEQINGLEDVGFRIKDAQHTMRYDLTKNILDQRPSLDNDLVFCEFNFDMLSDVLSIAKESFAGYGHYHADNLLDKTKSLEAYIDWVRRSCLDRDVADRFFVALVDNQVAGFLSFKVFDRNGAVYAAGGIGAVNSRIRGKGIFKQLVIHGLEWGIESGHQWHEHNVLCDNYPVNRAFASVGFNIVASHVTLHCWLT